MVLCRAVIMGAGGVEKVIEVELDETEKAAFDVSINAVRDLTNG